ncbi:VOC family protein [Flavitalea flava]
MHRPAMARLSALLLVLSASVMCSLSASSQGPHFSHTTIYVVDLAKSADFYENVLQLKKIDEPFHDNKHVWFKVGDHSQLHVVSGAKEPVAHDINIHLAFSVPSLAVFTRHLDEAHIKYGNWAGNTKDPQVRPDGIKQVYLQDPEGYWIEVNDDKF